MLKYEVQQQPDLIGSGVLNLDELYAKYKPFLQQLRASAAIPLASVPAPAQQLHESDVSTAEEPPCMAVSAAPSDEQQQDRKLYLVSCDVQHCFDTVDIAKLAALLPSTLAHEEYQVAKWTAVHPFR